MIICDQGGCTARATREIWLDSGLPLFACGHHCAEWFPWIDREVRFSAEPCTIVT